MKTPQDTPPNEALLAATVARDRAAVRFLVAVAVTGTLFAGVGCIVLVGYLTVQADEVVRVSRGALIVVAIVFAIAVGLAVGMVPIQQPPRARPRVRTVDEAIVERVEAIAARASTHPPEMIFVTLESGARVQDRAQTVFGHTRRELEIGATLAAELDSGGFDEAVARAFVCVTRTTKRSAAASVRAIALSAANIEDVGGEADMADSTNGLIARVLAGLVGHAAVWPARVVAGAAVVTTERTHAAAVAASSGAPRTAEHEARERALQSYLDCICRPLLALDLLPTDALAGLKDEESAEPTDEEVRERPDPLAELLIVIAGEDAFRPRLKRFAWSRLAHGELATALRQRARDNLAAWPGAESVRKKPARALRWFVTALDDGRAVELAEAADPGLKKLAPTERAQATNAVLATSVASLLGAALLFRGGELVDPLSARSIVIAFEGEQVDLFAIANGALAGALGSEAVRAWADRLGARREEGVGTEDITART